MQLKFKDNVLHLYNVKGMKHKKVILQGVPASKIFPSLVNHSKHVRPIYLNPLKLNKNKSVGHKHQHTGEQKNKQEQTSETKNNTEELPAIPELISKIQSMEQQIHSLENATKKIDEEVMSPRSLNSRKNQQAALNRSLRRKSVVMISYRRSRVLPIKNPTTALYRKKLKESKLLKGGFNKTNKQIKNNGDFKESKAKNKSKLKIGNMNDADGANLGLFSNRKEVEMLSENLKSLLKSKLLENELRPDILNLKTFAHNYNKFQHNLPNLNIPKLLQMDLNLEKNKYSSESEPSRNNETGVILESEKYFINSEQAAQIIKISQSIEDYSLNNTEKNYSILRNILEMKNITGKTEELLVQNQNVLEESCCDSKENHSMTNESMINDGSVFEVELLNSKCEYEINAESDIVPVTCNNVMDQHHIKSEELSKPDTKFKITIFINEKDDDSKKSTILGKNLSLIDNHMFNTELEANKFTEINPAKNKLMKPNAVGNDHTYKCTPIEEKITKTCYKPVSCPGALDKFKTNCKSFNSYMTKQNDFKDALNFQAPVAKSENQIPEPINKPYLSKMQRKAIQKLNERNERKRVQLNDSLQRDNLFNFAREKNPQGDTFSSLNTFLAIDRSNENKSIYANKSLNNSTKMNFKINPIKNFCNVTDNDHRFGDTEKKLKHINVMKCFQSTIDNKILNVNKPVSSFNETRMKNFVSKHEGNCKDVSFRGNTVKNITPFRYKTEPVIKERKIQTISDDTGKFNNLLGIANYENGRQVERFKEKENISLEDLQNQAICEEFMKHAGQKLSEYAENNWDNDVTVFSSFIGKDESEENIECSNECNDAKTTYDCTLSNSSLVKKETQSGIILNNKKKKTIKIKFSATVDKRKSMKIDNYDPEESEGNCLKLGKCIGCENLNELSLPVKKCEALVQINNEDGNDLKQYFSRLTKSHSDGNGIDSGYDSSKNKQDGVVEEIVTCIKQMTINETVNKNDTESIDLIALNGNLESEQEVSSINEIDGEKKENITDKSQTASGEEFKDEELYKDVSKSSRCEYCLNCQGKLSDSSKITNSTSENGNSTIGEFSPLQNAQSVSQNKSAVSVNSPSKYDLKVNGSNNNFNLLQPMSISPSEGYIKLEDKKSNKENPTTSKTRYENNSHFPSFYHVNYDSSVGLYSDSLNSFNQKICNGIVLKPITISSSNLLFDKKNELSSLSSFKKISIGPYNFQPLNNNLSVFTNNVDIVKNEKINLKAIITSPSNHIFRTELKHSDNSFNSLKVNTVDENDQLNSKLKLFAFQEDVFNLRRKMFKNILNKNGMVCDINQDNQCNKAVKCVSSCSVLKSNIVRNKSDLRQSYSESVVCFPTISSCSSDSTILSSESVLDNMLNTQAKLLKNLEQNIEIINLSSVQCMDGYKAIMDIYESVCEFYKLTSEWMNYCNKAYKNASDINVIKKVSDFENSIKTILSDIDANEEST